MDKVQQIKDNRLSARTKKAYDSAAGQLDHYLRKSHPDMFTDDKIDLNKLTVDAFLLFVMTKHEEGRVFSTLCVRLLILSIVLRPDCIFPLQSYRSALRNLFKVGGLPLPDKWEDEIKEFYGGLERVQAEQKQTGEREAVEGKEALPFALYEFLCRAFVKAGDTFAWAYLTLAWSTMCRTHNVATINLTHMAWLDEFLQITVPKTKTDQSTPFALAPRSF